MKCPECKSIKVFSMTTTTSTIDSGWARCFFCGHVFRLIRHVGRIVAISKPVTAGD